MDMFSAQKGAFSEFDVPGAGTGSGRGTLGGCINPESSITGDYLDASNVFHGYMRARDGGITKLDVPGAGAGPFQGTYPFCNNPADAVTGNYTDASGVAHGFLRIPCREGERDGECHEDNEDATARDTAPVTQLPSTVTPVDPAIRSRLPRLAPGPTN